MIAVDTNVFVRFLVEDDPKQSAAAARVFERAIAREEEIFISQIVLCEIVWVLSFAYEFSRGEIASVLHGLRRGANAVVEGADEVRRAIEAYAAGRADFADYLIAERATAAGCSLLITFDRALHSDTRFVAPDHY